MADINSKWLGIQLDQLREDSKGDLYEVMEFPYLTPGTSFPPLVRIRRLRDGLLLGKTPRVWQREFCLVKDPLAEADPDD